MSVVTPVCGRRRQLARLLSSLVGQDCPRDAFEVIVVDNPRRHNEAWLRDVRWPFSLHYEHVPVANRGLARNAGAAQARGGWLLFVDSDVIFTRSTVLAVLDAIREDPVGIVMADVSFPAQGQRTLGTHLLDVAAHFRTFRCKRRLGPLTFREFVSCSFAVDRRVFESVGRFDEGFWHYGYEDVEFALRAQKAGLSFDIAARVFHLKRLDPDAVLAQSIEAGRSAVHLVNLHPDIESTFPVGVADTIAGILAYPAGFDIAPLIVQAVAAERRWASRRGVDNVTSVRQLVDHARGLYRAITLYGRFIGITDELSQARK
ncbi:MAG: glycosyltransferase family 2 protein [Pseudonocardiaceae bacterium]